MSQQPPPPTTSPSPASPRGPAAAAAAAASAQPQGYSIELYFDPALENQVLKAWNVLARRQISSRLISISSRPHITLLSFSPRLLLDPARLLPPLRLLASRSDPIPLSLSSVSAHPSPSSDLFLGPVPTSSLLHFHALLCDAVRKELAIDPPDDFRVDSWLPAVPVAQDVPRNRMSEAFCVLRDLKLPVSGYAVDIGLVEFEPVQEIFSFPLGPAAAAAGTDASN